MFSYNLAKWIGKLRELEATGGGDVCRSVGLAKAAGHLDVGAPRGAVELMLAEMGIVKLRAASTSAAP